MPSSHSAVQPPLLTRVERERLLRRVTGAAVATACISIVLKGVASWRTDSTAVLGTLVDSSLDLIASLVSFVAVRHALVPADAEHRFGHGKAEQLAGFVQSLVVGASSVLLGVRGIERLRSPEPLRDVGWGAVTMIVTTVLTLALVAYQRRTVARTGSPAVAADSVHYASDVLLHGSVFVGLLAWRWLGLDWIDGALGTAIAVWLAIAAFRVGRGAWQGLMDRELPDATRAAILAAAVRPEVIAVYGLRTRMSGSTPIVQLELDLDGDLSLRDAHRVSAEVERAIEAAVPGADVLIHQHPAGEARPDALAHRDAW